MSGSIGDFDPFAGNTMGQVTALGSPSTASDASIAGMGNWDPFQGNTMPATPGGGGGINWNALAGTLKGLGADANKQQQQQQQQQQMRMQLAQSQAGRGGGAGGLGALLQMLNQRTNMYMGATNPQGAQPQVPQRPAGLLGI